MAQLIDTSVLVEMERRDLGLETLVSALDEEPLGVATITVSELLAGAFMAGSRARRARRESFLESLLDHVFVESFDLRAARVHARLWADLRAIGLAVGAHDLVIAASAVANGHAVVTNNLREFRRIPQLDVRQPRW